MFETKTFSATPANARRLLEFNKLKGTLVTEEVQELATRDTVASRLAESNIQLDDAQKAALQRILDWNGRGMLLMDKLDQGKEVAQAVCKLRGVNKVLVLCSANQSGPWAELFQTEFPELEICVFGNMRHKGSAKLPAGVKFEESPNTSADVIITNFMSVVWHDLLDNWVPEQVLVEEFSAAGSGISSLKNKETLAALFQELPSPLFLQNVTGYRHNGALLHSETRKRQQNILWDLEEILDWGVWASCGFPGRALIQKTPTVTKAMQGWGYGSLDAWRALPMLGVSTELVNMDNGPVTDHKDQRAASHFARGKKDGYSRVIQREREQLAEKGLTGKEVVRRALNGDPASKALIEGLRTMQWANAKAASIRTIIEDVGIFPARSLIICENPNLRRALLLNLSFTGYDKSSYCDVLPPMGDRDAIKARFFKTEALSGKPISAMLVSLQDLDDPALLHIADNIIFAEWPLDRAIYDVVKEEYALPNSCRLIQTTLEQTIEEEIRIQVTNL